MERGREIKSKPRLTLPSNWQMIALVGAFLVAATATAILTFAIVRDLVSTWNTTKIPDFVGGEPQSLEAILPPNLLEQGNTPLQPANGPAPVPWDGNRRVTVLVMGLDYRDWESEQGASRTDTLILFSIDPASRTAAMLSIPRDLWVNIPGFEPNKINTAYRLGEYYKVNGGGPGLAMQTVEKLLGQKVDYYAQIDFSAFERFIDELGGVKVNIPAEIRVDPIVGNPKTLKPGVQVLPGSLALAYARARDTEGSDFDRAERQQQVIMGIRNRILTPKTITNLIKKAPLVYENLASGVRTNLTLFQAIQLVWLARQIPEENIKRAMIGPNQASFGTSSDEQDILLPIPAAIRTLSDEIFTPAGPPEPATTETNPENLVKSEDALVSILNGTLSPGLAADTLDYLKSAGLTRVEAGNAEKLYSQTILIDYTGNPHTVEYLTQLLAIQPSNIYHRYDVNSQVDIVILLGDDWANNETLP